MNKDEKSINTLYFENVGTLGALGATSLGPEGNTPLQDPVATKINIEDEELNTDDHEVNMAKAELYKLAEYAPKLLELIDNYGELDGWIQAKITKAGDYVSDIYHYLKYEHEQPEGNDLNSEPESVEVVEIDSDEPNGMTDDIKQGVNDEIIKNLVNRF